MSSRDPGLQPERTALAWQRTGLSAGVTAALLLRTGMTGGSPLGLIGAGCVLIIVALGWLMGRRPGNYGAPRCVLLGTAVAVCLTGSLAVVELLSAVK